LCWLRDTSAERLVKPEFSYFVLRATRSGDTRQCRPQNVRNSRTHGPLGTFSLTGFQPIWTNFAATKMPCSEPYPPVALAHPVALSGSVHAWCEGHSVHGAPRSPSTPPPSHQVPPSFVTPLSGNWDLAVTSPVRFADRDLNLWRSNGSSRPVLAKQAVTLEDKTSGEPQMSIQRRHRCPRQDLSSTEYLA